MKSVLSVAVPAAAKVTVTASSAICDDVAVSVTTVPLFSATEAADAVEGNSWRCLILSDCDCGCIRRILCC